MAGSINHPAHLFRVAEEVARVRGQSPLDVLRADCTGVSSEIGPRGRVGDNRKRGVEDSEFRDCVGESCGLLGVNGCIQMFDGVE